MRCQESLSGTILGAQSSTKILIHPAPMLRTALAILALSAFNLSFAQVRMSQVDEVNQQVTIRNFGTTTQSVAGYWMCRAPGTYMPMTSLTIVSGDLSLSPGEEVTIIYPEVPLQGGVGLYLNAAGFGNPANLVDYVQYGGVVGFREPVGVGAGIWTAGTFAGGAAGPFVYTGNGTDNGADFWTTISPVPALPVWGLALMGVLVAGAASRRLRRA